MGTSAARRTTYRVLATSVATKAHFSRILAPVAKVRADQLLVQLGLAPTRTKAQALLLAGSVYQDEVRIDKPGTMLAEDTELHLRGETMRYVSRGGYKLEGALETFRVDVSDMRCLDLGASTGGFTDCLLQRGAREVIAVDVGYGQLAQKLRDDRRVHSLERTNAKSLKPGDIGGTVDLTVVDASFIGLGKLLPAIAECTRLGGMLVALVKPQFEVGREVAARGRGVVSDDAERKGAIESAVAEVAHSGFDVLGQCDSSLRGPKGNLEAFVHAIRV
jgi:23S rRNA (cytidine1920-2'-O)/16S rRNA (cytidine1409-2'-O)-methyltransferase